MNTVKDLIQALLECDQEAVVVLQGCDCEGTWSGNLDKLYSIKPAEILLER